MRHLLILLAIVGCATLATAQTAEELVAKNLQAHGGVEKIKAIKSLRMAGKFQQGPFTAQVQNDTKAPDLLRQELIIQGMALIIAYDGSSGWQISPFEGRKDPELLGEDDLREVEEDADFYGPLVDYQQKGNKIEYLGHDTVDGDDAYRLKVTLKNGDIFYYFLDPDSYMEIRIEKQRHIRGAVKETIQDLGSYKQVAGVYYPFSIESGQKRSSQRTKISFDKIEANVPLEDSEFKMPAAPAVPSPQAHPEPPAPKPPAAKPPAATAPGQKPATEKPPHQG
ncbi:MAG: LolA family protein [Terriglobales bacterium]